VDTPSNVDHEENASQNTLVVASKLKAYIKQKSEMNTSASVFPILSEKLRALCDQAIEHAKSEKRKTVMDRDFV